MKKLLYLALALALVLTLAACVKNDVTTAAPDPTNAPHTHSYGDWTVATAATCTEDGVKERACSCGEKETETIAATGHIYPTDDSSITVSGDGNAAEIDATCTACGHAEKGAYTGVLVRGGAAYRFVGGARVTIEKEIFACDGVRYWVIGNVIQTGVYVPVDGCIYYFGEDGEMVCGGSNGEYDFDENGALTGSDIVLDIGGERYEISGSTASVHTHSYSATTTAPTCTESGYTIYTCRCGATYEDDIVSKTGHNYVDGVCSFCGDVERTPSKGLIYELNDDRRSYSVTGIGTCKDTDMVIPSVCEGLPVTSIGAYAFSGCSSLTIITIPDSVTSIGKRAFEGCSSLTRVTIPNSVTSIGSFAFKFCTGLTSITLPDSAMSVGEYAFESTAYYNDVANWEDDVLYIGNHLIKAKKRISGAYSIKASTKCVASYAFSGCSKLTNVAIPDCVTSIGDWAFYYCTGLTNITFEGTKAQWNAISKGNKWNYDTGKYTIYCTDGEISK